MTKNKKEKKVIKKLYMKEPKGKKQFIINEKANSTAAKAETTIKKYKNSKKRKEKRKRKSHQSPRFMLTRSRSPTYYCLLIYAF